MKLCHASTASLKGMAQDGLCMHALRILVFAAVTLLYGPLLLPEPWPVPKANATEVPQASGEMELPALNGTDTELRSPLVTVDML